MSVNEAQLEAMVGTVLTDMAAGLSVANVAVGDRLGLYAELARSGRTSAADLASRTGLEPLLVSAWLRNQAVGGYVDHDPAGGTFSLTEEARLVLADPDSPVFMAGVAEIIQSAFADIGRIADAFRGADAFGWHEHSTGLFTGTERLFRPGYQANLESSWIPALDGVEEKLRAGGRVADVGCGHGASTIVLAQAYSASTFEGSDYHQESIDRARKLASDAGVSERVRFTVASGSEYPGADYDLVCLFDCLHDMGDPVGVLSHVRQTLAPDGTVLLVEPQAPERLEDGIGDPVARLFSAAAATVCLPNALSQATEPPLHTQSPVADHRAVAEAAGFSSFREAVSTGFNRIFELKA